jgi:hypothetical protein
MIDEFLHPYSTIKSPFVVKVFGVTGPENGWIVTEHCEDQRLDQDFGPFDWKFAFKIGTEIVAAIFSLHSSNPPLIHKDLQAHNVLVSIRQRNSSSVQF